MLVTAIGERRTNGGCKVLGCGRKILAKGLCEKHYRRRHDSGKSMDDQEPIKVCITPGCNKSHTSHGFCHQHAHLVRKFRHAYVRKGRGVDKSVQILCYLGVLKWLSLRGVCTYNFEPFEQYGRKGCIVQERTLEYLHSCVARHKEALRKAGMWPADGGV